MKNVPQTFLRDFAGIYRICLEENENGIEFWNTNIWLLGLVALRILNEQSVSNFICTTWIRSLFFGQLKERFIN